MDRETTGIVISAQKLWWLKINTKPLRRHALDGAVFPHIIRVGYMADGQQYFKRKWIGAGNAVPSVGSSVKVVYCADKPSRAKVIW